MKKKIYFISFIILSSILISCKNQLSGKKYSAKILDLEVMGLDFLDNSKVEIYEIDEENKIAQYNFNKKTNIIEIPYHGMVLSYNPFYETLYLKKDNAEFNFRQVEEINISDVDLSDFFF